MSDAGLGSIVEQVRDDFAVAAAKVGEILTDAQSGRWDATLAGLSRDDLLSLKVAILLRLGDAAHE